MKNFILLVFLALLGLTSPAFASDTALKDSGKATEATLTTADRNDLRRIETYLNSLRSISADFLQVDDGGTFRRGAIAIQRPGKMRVTYDTPNKDFIIADGDWMHIWNDDLQAQTNVEQGTSLAEFILRDPIHLNGDVTITGFKRFPAKIEVTLCETADPAAGSLTLVFEDHPLLLRQWKVLDPQGHTTGVNLENERDDVTFPASTFIFVPPNFGKGGRAGN